MTEPMGTDMIERYLRTRGRRYFRGQHDGEYFFVANAHPSRLHVHLGGHRNVFTVRIAPACFFPVADDARLAQLADKWNQRNRELTATLHGSSDPKRIGIYTSGFKRIADHASFEDFASYVDRTITAATKFFAELTPAADLPATDQPLLRDAG